MEEWCRVSLYIIYNYQIASNIISYQITIRSNINLVCIQQSSYLSSLGQVLQKVPQNASAFHHGRQSPELVEPGSEIENGKMKPCKSMTLLLLKEIKVKRKITKKHAKKPQQLNNHSPVRTVSIMSWRTLLKIEWTKLDRVNTRPIRFYCVLPRRHLRSAQLVVVFLHTFTNCNIRNCAIKSVPNQNVTRQAS